MNAGELGKCPTCGEQVSTNAKSCPHCGERKFKEMVRSYHSSACVECLGKKEISPGYACTRCAGTGLQLKKEAEVDLRTGKESRSQEFPVTTRSYHSQSQNSGCMVMLVFICSMAVSLVVMITYLL